MRSAAGKKGQLIEKQKGGSDFSAPYVGRKGKPWRSIFRTFKEERKRGRNASPACAGRTCILLLRRGNRGRGEAILDPGGSPDRRKKSAAGCAGWRRNTNFAGGKGVSPSNDF